MLILGIESSCDDTGAAVVRDGTRVLSSVVASQDAIHGEYGGVVPELASRRHIEDIIPVVEEALKRAKVTIDEIDAIGVTQGPGLVGSILVGLSFAKAVSYVKEKPFVGVNHLEAHPLSVFLDEGDGPKEVPEFPFVALVVSGGHTALLSYEDFIEYRVLGQTRDDAAGEAFDKVAKLLGLGYPGGLAIDTFAREGDPEAFAFTRPYIAKGNLEFSFSGIKTAVLNKVKGLKKEGPMAPLTDEKIKDLAASFQEATVDVLVQKAVWALEQTGAGSLVCAGGVACNSRLRERLKGIACDKGIKLFIPPAHLCSDNGAMVAATAFHLLKKGVRGELSMNARPAWEG
jgi:N6-L-threonylcarbamoyladenine synthase